MSTRYAVRERILGMDPQEDFEEIYRLHTTVEFPWDVQRALELALFRTYAVPSVAQLLDTTQEFALRGQKRYDDTGLLLTAAVEHGLDSTEGRGAVRRINAIHRQFEISNDDLLYVLSTFIVVPLRFVDRWGWRPLTEHERVATHSYYSALGRRMAIEDIPATWQAMARFSDDYEAEHFARTRETRAVAEATMAIVAGWLAPLPISVIKAFVLALMDQPLRDSFGYPAAPALIRALVPATLSIRAQVERRLRPRSAPARFVDSRFVQTPLGYRISDLGPAPWGTDTTASRPPTARR